MKTKAQVAVEGFTTIAIILIFYALLILMTVDRDADLKIKSEVMDNRDACIAMQSAISYVWSAGEGTVYRFNISSDETINILDNYMDVGADKTHACILPVEVETTILAGGEVRVINENNSISIQNV